MIYARIDSLDTKNIVGFECGNRENFDKRHGGDPLWVFVDSNIARFRIHLEDFQKDHRLFFIDKRGFIQRRPETIDNT